MPVLNAEVQAAAANAAPDPRPLFPRGVSVLSSPVQATLDGLHPEERACVARAVPKRQHEFATGRRLAHQLLARLGAPDFALLSDADRAPIWPEGLIGSISHSHGLCVVAVSPRGALSGLGVDVEEACGVRPELWRRVMRPEEEEWLRAQPGAPQLHLAAVFFSAKEAVYKAQYPLTRARLGFHDVGLELEPSRGIFRSRVPGFARWLPGAFSLDGGWVLSGLALAAGDVPE
jgi:4'-phosphopantetheinyl transferase EntD